MKIVTSAAVGQWALATLVCWLVAGVAAADEVRLRVWAIGLPHGYIAMEHQQKAIEVTGADVAQGFVTVAAGTRLVIKTRSREDYVLHIAPLGTLFQSVQVEGIGHAVELDAGGGTIIGRDAPAGTFAVTLSYRFRLAPGTVPGTYPWPLEVSVPDALAHRSSAPLHAAGVLVSTPAPAARSAQ